MYFLFCRVVGGSTTRQNQLKVDEDIQIVGTDCDVYKHVYKSRQLRTVLQLGIICSVKFWLKSGGGIMRESLGCPGYDQAQSWPPGQDMEHDAL